MNEPKFDPIAYESYRPLYPGEAFRPIISAMRNLSPPIALLDLGCGTGAATESLLRALTPDDFASFEITAVDPDHAMLEQARTRLASYSSARISYVRAPAESIPLADETQDLVLVGSAFHWFDIPRAIDELTRVTKPRGIALLFEYQFPKTPVRPELNEWIRREFNERWRAPKQVPRGSLKEISKPWRTHPKWREMPTPKTEMVLPLTAEGFVGHLMSQSRYLHFEATLDEEEKTSHRKELLQKVLSIYRGEPRLPFDFYFQSFQLERI